MISLENCLFCKIVREEIPAQKIYEDDHVIGFVDIHPQAKAHLLFIHKSHTKDINEMSESPASLAQVFHAIKKYTQDHKFDEHGFRVVTNMGRHGGQTVFHTHFHVLADEPLGPFGRYKNL